MNRPPKPGDGWASLEDACFFGRALARCAGDSPREPVCLRDHRGWGYLAQTPTGTARLYLPRQRIDGAAASRRLLAS